MKAKSTHSKVTALGELPKAYRSIVNRCITELRGRLANGEHEISCAFVGNTKNDSLRIIPYPPADPAERVDVSKTIVNILETDGVDFVLIVSEGWSITSDNPLPANPTQEDKDRCVASLHVDTICLLKLGTREGHWAASPKTHSMPDDARLRAMGNVVFEATEKEDGGLAELLLE